MPKPGFASALALLLCSVALEAQTCVPQLLGADRRGPAESISRTGSTLYVGTGAALLVVDVTDRANPVERGFVNLDGVVRDVAAAGEIAVVLANPGLVLVDASAPAEPVVAGSWPIDPSWNVRHVDARDSLAFFVAADGLHIVDFFDPTNPAEVGFLAAADARDVVSRSSTRAYLLVEGPPDADGALVVVDVSDPAEPVIVSSRAVREGADGRLSIGPNGGRTAAWGTTVQGHHIWWDLVFFDTTDPDQPAARSGMGDTDEGLGSVTLAGDRAYVGPRIVDISNLGNPQVRGALPGGYPEDVATTGDPGLVYVADAARGVPVVDVSKPADAEIVDIVELPGKSMLGYMAGNFAVVLDERGLRAIDLTDRHRPATLGELRPPDVLLYSLTGLSTHALIGGFFDDSYYASRLVDLSDPENPALGEDLPWITAHAVIDGNRLYALTGCGETVSLFDVADPAIPAQVGEVVLTEGCRSKDFTADGDRLYVWEDVDGSPDDAQALRSFDVSLPASPIELGSPLVPRHRGSSTARGRTLMVADQEHFDVLGLSDPTSPTLLGTTPLPGTYGRRGHALDSYGSRAAVTTVLDESNNVTNFGSRIIDFSRLSAPYEWGILDTPGSAEGAFFGPGIIVVADGAAGYSIYESCVPFSDGFESGDTSEWSLLAP